MESHYSYKIHESKFLLYYHVCNEQKLFRLYAIGTRKGARIGN